MLKKSFIATMVLTLSMVLFGAGMTSMVGVAEASSEVHAEEVKEKSTDSSTAGIKAIAAALAIAGCAIGTAMAQMKIGSAGAGAIAERPETAAMFIVLVAIPETIVILGFVIAAMLIVL